MWKYRSPSVSFTARETGRAAGRGVPSGPFILPAIQLWLYPTAEVPKLQAAAHYRAMACWPPGCVSGWPVCMHAFLWALLVAPFAAGMLAAPLACVHARVKVPTPPFPCRPTQKGWGPLPYCICTLNRSPHTYSIYYTALPPLHGFWVLSVKENQFLYNQSQPSFGVFVLWFAGEPWNYYHYKQGGTALGHMRWNVLAKGWRSFNTLDNDLAVMVDSWFNPQKTLFSLQLQLNF